MRTLDEISPGVTIDSLPFTITQPGVYTIGRICTCPPGEYGITVLADNVTIDFNGFGITGAPSSLDAVRLQAGFIGATIRHGSISGMGGSGVSASGAGSVRLEDVFISSCAGDGVSLSSGSLKGCEISGNGGAGVRCKGGGGTTARARLVITDSCSREAVIQGNGGGGVAVESVCDVSLDGVDIVGNTGDGVSYKAITTIPAHGTLYQSSGRCASNTGDGVHVEVSGDGTLDFRVRGEVCDDNNSDGIDISCVSQTCGVSVDVSGGSCSSNGGAGVRKIGGKQKAWLCSNFRLNRNGGPGLSIGPDCVSTVSLDTCDVSENGGNGIQNGGAVSSSSDWVVNTCTVRRNALHGMSVALRGIEKAQIKRGCAFDGNGGDGFHAESASAGAQLSLSCEGSTFSSNLGAGLRALRPHPHVVMVLGVDTCELTSNHGDALDMDDDGDGIETRLACTDSSLSDNGGRGYASTSHGSGGRLEVKFIRVELKRNAAGGVDQDCDGVDRQDWLEMSECSALSNALDGVRVVSHGTGGAMRVAMDRCAADSNGGGGMSVGSDCSGQRLSVRCADSSFSSNAADGLHVAAPRAVLLCSTTHSRCVASGNIGDGIDEDCDSSDTDGCTLDENGQNGLLLACNDGSVRSSSTSRNGATGTRCVCAAGWAGAACRSNHNGLDGVDVAAEVVQFEDSATCENGASGARFLHTHGVIHRDLAARNVLLGLEVTASNTDISGCQVMGQRDTSGVSSSVGIQVDGDNNHIHGNFVADNDFGISVDHGTSHIYQNEGGNNTNWLFGGASSVIDAGPGSSAAGATSPTGNIGF